MRARLPMARTRPVQAASLVFACVVAVWPNGSVLAKEPAPAATSEARENPDPHTSDPAGHIVVKGRRWGQAEIAAESVIDENAIDSFSATTIGELLDRMTSLIDSRGQSPELLVNGKRITNPAELKDYPKEALARIAILPKTAAAVYGFEPEKRVVNLELKRKFASWQIQSEVEMPTAGGRRNATLRMGRFIIDGDTRWNIGANVADETELLRSERQVPVQPAAQTLLDALGAAGAGIDPNRYESLFPRSNAQGFNASVTHPVGAFSGSVNFSAGRRESARKIGMPVAIVQAPAGEDYGLLAAEEALQNRQRSESISTGLSLSGPVEGWQTSFGFRYSVNWAKSARDVGYDARSVQQRIDDGAEWPLGADQWGNLPLLTDRLASTSEVYNLSLTASRPVADLPAGPMRTSVSLNANRFLTNSSYFDADANQWSGSHSSRYQFDGLVSLSLPVASRGAGVLDEIGDLTATISGAFRKVTKAKTNYRLSGALDWSPASFVNLRTAYSRENVEPGYDQLFGPRMEIVNRVFDFRRDEYVQVLYRFGGNPDLAGGTAQNLSADMSLMPFGPGSVTFNVGYRRSITNGGISSLPDLTPVVEAAFPDRIIRDPSGKLVLVDARAIRIASERSQRLTSGISFRWTEKPPALSNEAENVPPVFAPWTVTASLTHQWSLQSQTQIRPELAIIDRLEGGGQARHRADFQLDVGRKGLGASVSASWNGPAYVLGAGGAIYRYWPSTMFNLGGFIEPGSIFDTDGQKKWIDALKLSVDIQNLFDSRKVIESPGRPDGFSRDELDPLGRTIRFTINTSF